MQESFKIPTASFPSVSGSICTFNSQYAGLPLKSHVVDVDYMGSAISGVNVGCDNKYAGFINFNQLVQNGNFANDTGWAGQQATLSVNDNIGTITGTSNYARLELKKSYIPNVESGHKYFLSATMKKNQDVSAHGYALLVYVGGGNASVRFGNEIDTWTTYSVIFSCSSGKISPNYIYFADAQTDYQSGYMADVKNCFILDLTTMFGAGNEPSTVDDVRALFPNDYYDYNAGTLTTVSAVNGVSNSFFPIAFDTPIYGGQYDCLTGIVTSNKDSGGGDVSPTYQQTATANCETNLGVNNIWADTGDTTLQYPKFG